MNKAMRMFSVLGFVTFFSGGVSAMQYVLVNDSTTESVVVTLKKSNGTELSYNLQPKQYVISGRQFKNVKSLTYKYQTDAKDEFGNVVWAKPLTWAPETSGPRGAWQQIIFRYQGNGVANKSAGLHKWKFDAVKKEVEAPKSTFKKLAPQD